MKRALPLGLALLAVLLAVPAFASHFRGMAMVPTVSSSGLLTVQQTGFWRNGTAGPLGISVSGGVGSMALQSSSIDTSDSRYDVANATFTAQLPGAGTYNLTAGTCCRVATGSPGNGVNNWFASSFTMNSTIVWDGTNAANPIAFNFANVQSNVFRGGPYSQNLNATSPDNLTLTYNQNLNQNITSQPPGFSIDPNTGQMTIPAGAGGTAAYTDNNNTFSVGADAAFSGNIIASDGSSVEFDWMFDGTDQAQNQPPEIMDAMMEGNVGDIFQHMFTAVDPDGDALTWDPVLFGIQGPAPPAIPPVWDANTQQFVWNSAGSTPGTYLFFVRVFDSFGASDVGVKTIVLEAVVPEPASMLVWLFGGGAVAAAGVIGRRRKRKQKVGAA